jgi:DNA-binding LacI/PurR family transcriptional regulator
MAQPMREMGRDACRHLFTAIGAADKRTIVSYSMTLVVRESTAAPRTAPERKGAAAYRYRRLE